MEKLLNFLNAQTKFIKKYKVETDCILAVTTYKHSAEITLYINEGNSNKVMAKLIEEGLEFHKESFSDSEWLNYRIEFKWEGINIMFIKKNK